MLFNTTQFFVFFVIVISLFYALPRSARRYLLLAASYYFYGSWNVFFLPLLWAITIVDYFSAIWMGRLTSPGRRRAFLFLSLAVNLGFLGFFKYYNFLAESLAAVIGQQTSAFTLSIILPIGISFHTFQSMSYVIDVYRREQEPVRDFIDYALYIAFFPQLVAGPIVRAKEFFHDYLHWVAPTQQEALRGLLWMAIGLAKKMVLADQFALIADAYFGSGAAQPGALEALTPGALQAWSGTIAFAMQIFFDFSGYTDMAIGMALLLGFHFPVNFERPYLAFSITDFWRRWHMTLSRWLRDYLYIPLGGSRGTLLFTYRNLMLTMLIGGLWHGASWNFVIWGGFHGALLVLERMFGRHRFLDKPGPWLYPFRAAITFGLVCVGWVFFRAQTLDEALFVIGQMFSGVWTAGGSLIPVWLLVLIGISLGLAIIEEKYEAIERLAEGGQTFAYVAVMVVLLISIELIGVIEQTVPFVYFQF